jgi:hypothetical protein
MAILCRITDSDNSKSVGADPSLPLTRVDVNGLVSCDKDMYWQLPVANTACKT